jgi:hypothetical protein
LREVEPTLTEPDRLTKAKIVANDELKKPLKKWFEIDMAEYDM